MMANFKSLLERQNEPNTYQDLINAYTKTAAKLPRNPYELVNDVSALTGWARFFCGTLDAPIGKELKEQYQDALAAFTKHLQSENNAKSTIYKRRSQINKWHTFYESISLISTMPRQFHEAL